jgi:hypothetical protein
MGFMDFIRKIGHVFTSIGSIGSTIKNIITKITNMIKCLVAFFTFIAVFFSYCGNFSIWIFTYLLPWVGQYIECIFQKIISLPKCFFWYLLDSIAWIIYLPFRIVFWSFGMEDFVRDYFWCLLEDLDKFIHDEKGGLGTGIHIIHFPDSVMEKCYYCKIEPLKKKMPSTCNLTKSYKKFINCNKSNKENKLNKCASNVTASYFESPKDAKSNGPDFGTID